MSDSPPDDENYTETTLSDGELELLIRVDEQTKATADGLDELAEQVETNRDDIDDLQDTVKRNTTIIGGISGGVSMIALWAADKVSRFM